MTRVRINPDTGKPDYPEVLHPDDAPCPKHPSWMAGAPKPPPGLSCPACESEARSPVEPPSSQSAFEVDPKAVFDQHARRLLGNGPRAEKVLMDVRRRDAVRNARDKAVENRRQEIIALEHIIESRPSSGYVPPPTRSGGEVPVTPKQRRRHAEKVRAAKARLNYLRSAPLDFQQSYSEASPQDLRGPTDSRILPRHERMTPAEREALAKGIEPDFWKGEQTSGKDTGESDGDERLDG